MTTFDNKETNVSPLLDFKKFPLNCEFLTTDIMRYFLSLPVPAAVAGLEPLTLR
jgi:hypothetical protein